MSKGSDQKPKPPRSDDATKDKGSKKNWLKSLAKRITFHILYVSIR